MKTILELIVDMSFILSSLFLFFSWRSRYVPVFQGHAITIRDRKEWEDMYVDAKEVMRTLRVSRDKVYKIIQSLNEELKRRAMSLSPGNTAANTSMRNSTAMRAKTRTERRRFMY